MYKILTHVVSLDGVVGAISDAVEDGGAVARVLAGLQRLVDGPSVNSHRVKQVRRVDRHLQGFEKRGVVGHFERILARKRPRLVAELASISTVKIETN